jgi:hypothetical protein
MQVPMYGAPQLIDGDELDDEERERIAKAE